ncbi:MAG: protein translocase subunit SecD [Thermodesulfobacteriota bacterium]
MQKALKWKLALLVSMILIAGVMVLPSFYANTPSWWKKYLAPEGLRLGLDLQGGMHLVLKVELDRAEENSLNLAAQELKEALAEKQITLVQTRSGDPRAAIFTLPNTGALEQVREVVKNDFPNLAADIQAESGVFPRVTLRLTDEQVQFIRKHAVDQSLEIIRNRIDQFGVAEPVIIRQGADEIVVQLPGVKDPQRALSLIGQTAQLEFKLVEDGAAVDLNTLISQAVAAGQWQPGQSRRQLNFALQSRLPAGSEIYFMQDIDKQTGKEVRVPILLKSQTLMTGEMIKDAQVRVGGNFNEPYVSLDFTSRGGKVFGQITERSVGKRFAIVLDEVVRSAPVIREKILGGSAQISGGFTYNEAADLAIVLRVGALPAPVDIIQNLTVGASLGQDSISKGLMSGLLGTALVFGFMLIFYRLSGVIANAALVLNILFLFAGLAALQATLTLPGIAGIILSIGMAVDSNILIFERMRDEFALGKSVKSGVDGGYAKALWSIVDSQVTTLITALALFLFGTGPIKGFAVTLSLGIIFNLFTTLFGTRLIYDILFGGRKLKELRFLPFPAKPNINFMGTRKVAFVFSAVVSLIGLIAFVQFGRGAANMGIDFAGGTMLQYKAEHSFTLPEVRRALAASGLAEVDLQQVEGENRLIVKIKSAAEKVSGITGQVSGALQEQLAAKGFALESQSEIGSSVSDALREKALEAIIISMIGVILYLALRFDLKFGLAAAISTFHDVLAVLAICWLLDIEMNLLIVTSLLTLAGYSLNDTVVIFDRVREQMKKMPDTDLLTVINVSTNEVLFRSLMTAGTTMLVLMALLLFGGTVIHDFAFTLLFGIAFGTYSSVFVASPVLHLLRKRSATPA